MLGRRGLQPLVVPVGAFRLCRGGPADTAIIAEEVDPPRAEDEGQVNSSRAGVAVPGQLVGGKALRLPLEEVNPIGLVRRRVAGGNDPAVVEPKLAGVVAPELVIPEDGYRNDGRAEQESLVAADHVPVPELVEIEPAQRGPTAYEVGVTGEPGEGRYAGHPATPTQGFRHLFLVPV